MGLERIHLHPHDDDWNAVFVCDRCCEDTKLQNMFWDNETYAYVCSHCAAREQAQAPSRRHTDGHALLREAGPVRTGVLPGVARGRGPAGAADLRLARYHRAGVGQGERGRPRAVRLLLPGVGELRLRRLRGGRGTSEIETTIKGIRCVLELWEEDGEQRSSLFLYKKDPLNGDEYQGSLQLCQYEGGIPLFAARHSEGPMVWALSQATFDAIEEWADTHGY